MRSFEEDSFIQYEKNYNLLRKNDQRSLPSSLDYEYIQNIYFYMVTNQEFAQRVISSKDEEKNTMVYILLSLLSMFEVEHNITHFDFVIKYNCFFDLSF